MPSFTKLDAGNFIPKNVQNVPLLLGNEELVYSIMNCIIIKAPLLSRFGTDMNIKGSDKLARPDIVAASIIYKRVVVFEMKYNEPNPEEGMKQIIDLNYAKGFLESDQYTVVALSINVKPSKMVQISHEFFEST